MTLQDPSGAVADLDRGCERDEWSGALRTFLRDDRFGPVHGLSPPERHRRTYAQLRALNEWAGGGVALLADDQRLFWSLEWAAIVDPSLFHAMTVHYGVCLAAVLELGDRERLRGPIAQLDSASAIGSILITEIGRGSSHISVQTTATYDDDAGAFVLDTPDAGARKLMPNVGLPGIAKFGLVYARLHVHGRECGVFPFLVSVRDEHRAADGVHISPLPETAVVPLDYALVEFNHVEVPFDHWLADGATIDAAGEFHDPLGSPDARLVRSLTISHNASKADAVGLAAVARASALIAIRYAQHRTTMGRLSPNLPLIRYRTHQRPLVRGLAMAYAVTSMVERLQSLPVGSDGAGEGDAAEMTWAPWAAVDRELALAKVLATNTAEAVAAECRRRCGAQGVLAENRLVAYEGLAMICNSAGGENTLILLDAARTMAEGVGYDPLPGGVESPGDANLRDREAWLSLARARERDLYAHLVNGVAQTRATSPDAEPLDVWNDWLDIGIELATAHTHRLALESFIEAIDRIDDPAFANLMTRLASVYALEEIASHAAAHIVNGRLGSAQLDDIRRLIIEALDVLVPQLDALLDSLRIPDEVLRVPITTERYVNAYVDTEKWAPSRAISPGAVELTTAAALPRHGSTQEPEPRPTQPKPGGP